MQICAGCGCTDNDACMTPEGPCHWVAEDLCSACAADEVDHVEEWRPPPLCAHDWLFTDPVNAHCVYCDEIKSHSEAA